jgi:hypothetical protein
VYYQDDDGPTMPHPGRHRSDDETVPAGDQFADPTVPAPDPTARFSDSAALADDPTARFHDETVPVGDARARFHGPTVPAGDPGRTMPLLPQDHSSSMTAADSLPRRIPAPRVGGSGPHGGRGTGGSSGPPGSGFAAPEFDGRPHPSYPAHSSRRVDSARTPISLRIGRGVEAVQRSRQVRTAAHRAGSLAWRIGNIVLTVAIIAAASWAGWQWWQRWHPQLAVSGVTVTSTATGSDPCDTQYDFVGTIATNGKAGTVTYQWQRSDGQSTKHLTVNVPAGRRSTVVHLYWTFSGTGSQSATATLNVSDPGSAQGSAEVAYACVSQ